MNPIEEDLFTQIQSHLPSIINEHESIEDPYIASRPNEMESNRGRSIL